MFSDVVTEVDESLCIDFLRLFDFFIGLLILLMVLDLGLFFRYEPSGALRSSGGGLLTVPQVKTKRHHFNIMAPLCGAVHLHH